MNRTLRALLVLAIVASIAACGDDDESGSSEARTADPELVAAHDAAYAQMCADAEYDFDHPTLPAAAPVEGTLTIDTELGEVTVPATPEAAVGMYMTDVDILLALGVELAGTQPYDGRSPTWPCYYDHDVLAAFEVFDSYPEYNYELIAAARPDFILNGLGHDPEIAELLGEIAPTYSFLHYDGNWLDNFEQVAIDLGRTEQHQAWKDFYDARLAEVRAELEAKHGDLSKLTVAMVDPFTDAGLYPTCSYGVECSVFDELGLTTAALALANDGQGTPLSAEQFEQLDDLDFAFLPSDGLGLPSNFADIEGNPLWDTLGWAAAGDYAAYEYSITFGGPSAQLAFLDTVRRALMA